MCMRQPSGNHRTRGYFPAMMSRHPLARTYLNMIYRCFDSKHPLYPRYGGRGISITDEWLPDEKGTGEGFLNFIRDVGERPVGTMADGRSCYGLERRDNDRDYSRDNCYWKKMDTKEKVEKKVEVCMGINVDGDTRE